MDLNMLQYDSEFHEAAMWGGGVISAYGIFTSKAAKWPVE
jgi:hypothetical protein